MMASLTERLQLARANGGGVATAYWLANRLLRVETYKFLAIELPVASIKFDMPLPGECSYLCLGSKEAFAQCDPQVIDMLDRNNGVMVADTIARGGRVYAIVRGQQVLSQQRVEFGQTYTRSPYPMNLYVGEREAYFSYLYTAPTERGRGWARRLSAYAMNDLAEQGISRCMSHIRATNVASLATRLACGWRVVGLLYTFKPAQRGYLRRLHAWRELGCKLNVERANA